MLTKILVRLSFSYYRFLEEGFFWSINRIIKIAINLIGYILLLPVCVLLRFAGYRSLTVNSARIGHLTGEVDCFLKLQSLDLVDSKFKYFIFKGKSISNNIFWGYVKKKIRVVDSSYLCIILKFMCFGPGIRLDISDYLLALNQAAKYYEVCRIWGDRPPIFSLEEEHTRLGIQALNDLGVPAGASYVCIHVRSSGYAVEDDAVHRHRNFPLESFDEAIKIITSRGYYCILMGDPNSPKIQTGKMVIDYAHSEHRSDLIDVFLCGSCKFFLGNSSGLFILSTVFGVPCALTNMLPFTCTGFTKRDFSIPKLLRKSGAQKYLTLSEIVLTKIANFRNANQYSRNSIEVIPNTSDDVCNLVSDMFDSIDGQIPISLIENQRAIFFEKLQPVNYCYGSSSNISPSFIKKYSEIF